MGQAEEVIGRRAEGQARAGAHARLGGWQGCGAGICCLPASQAGSPPEQNAVHQCVKGGWIEASGGDAIHEVLQVPCKGNHSAGSTSSIEQYRAVQLVKFCCCCQGSEKRAAAHAPAAQPHVRAPTHLRAPSVCVCR